MSEKQFEMNKPEQVGKSFYGLEGYRKGKKKLITLKRLFAVFRCSCGEKFICEVRHIGSGNTKSCGCHNNKVRAERGRSQFTTHGMTRSREFRSWEGMLQRCYNKNATGYERWGGAGVTVCDEWRESFESFLRDMGKRPQSTSLDRINPFGNYEPSNCRWADIFTQNTNTRKNVIKNANRAMVPAASE